jgi:hypothetical protein
MSEWHALRENCWAFSSDTLELCLIGLVRQASCSISAQFELHQTDRVVDGVEGQRTNLQDTYKFHEFGPTNDKNLSVN